MKESVQDYLKTMHGMDYVKEKNSDIQVIPQSIISCSSKQQIALGEKREKRYILFPTSFREVKAIEHVLEELYFISSKYLVDVLIFGPLLDQKYYQRIVSLMTTYS